MAAFCVVQGIPVMCREGTLPSRQYEYSANAVACSGNANLFEKERLGSSGLLLILASPSITVVGLETTTSLSNFGVGKAQHNDKLDKQHSTSVCASYVQRISCAICYLCYC